MAKTAARTAATTMRNAHLRDILFERRRELQEDVQRRISDRRTDRPSVRDALERTDADLSDDVEFVLIQMKAETMSRIGTAISQLEAGDYGRCFECDVEIAETRLRALPFAVRCKPCEEQLEQGEARTRRLADQQTNSSRFAGISGN